MNTLHKLIEQALENGWGMFGHAGKPNLRWEVVEASLAEGEFLLVTTVDEDGNHDYLYGKYYLEQILFDPDFAIALFGDSLTPHLKVAWIYHIQQYAPLTDRLEYLEKWLGEERA